MNQIYRLTSAVLGMLLVAGALPVQGGAAECERPRYRLIDLGTFGGPASYFQNGFDGILNNSGTAVGWANTSSPDPFDPFCADPDNCFVTHAFRVKDGKPADLGTLPGGINSAALWISANGLIAGSSDNGELDPAVPGMPQRHAVLWRHGQIVDLGTLPDGGQQSGAISVNNLGQVVGFAINNIPDPFFGQSGQFRAFLWQDGVMQDLGTFGGPDAQAYFINDRSEVAGLATTAIDPGTGFPAAIHTFLWRHGKMHDLGSLGGTDSEPTALNERGEVVGSSTLAGDTLTHPFLWSQGHMKDLGTLGGDNGTTEWVNDYGEVVGKADLPGPAPQLHDAVLWRKGKTIDLGVLPGDGCSLAFYVNLRGQVVGTSENQALCRISGEHAFLWEKGGPMIDLNTQIPPGANLQLTYAVAINDRGEIAGFGVPSGCAPQDYLKCGHAYLLMPCKEGEKCKNITLGDAATLPAIAPGRSETLENPRAKSATPSDNIRTRFQQRMRLPGGRAVPAN